MRDVEEYFFHDAVEKNFCALCVPSISSIDLTRSDADMGYFTFSSNADVECLFPDGTPAFIFNKFSIELSGSGGNISINYKCISTNKGNIRFKTGRIDLTTPYMGSLWFNMLLIDSAGVALPPGWLKVVGGFGVRCIEPSQPIHCGGTSVRGNCPDPAQVNTIRLDFGPNVKVCRCWN